MKNNKGGLTAGPHLPGTQTRPLLLCFARATAVAGVAAWQRGGGGVLAGRGLLAVRRGQPAALATRRGRCPRRRARARAQRGARRRRGWAAAACGRSGPAGGGGGARRRGWRSAAAGGGAARDSGARGGAGAAGGVRARWRRVRGGAAGIRQRRPRNRVGEKAGERGEVEGELTVVQFEAEDGRERELGVEVEARRRTSMAAAAGVPDSAVVELQWARGGL